MDGRKTRRIRIPHKKSDNTTIEEIIKNVGEYDEIIWHCVHKISPTKCIIEFEVYDVPYWFQKGDQY